MICIYLFTLKILLYIYLDDLEYHHKRFYRRKGEMLYLIEQTDEFRRICHHSVSFTLLQSTPVLSEGGEKVANTNGSCGRQVR